MELNFPNPDELLKVKLPPAKPEVYLAETIQMFSLKTEG